MDGLSLVPHLKRNPAASLKRDVLYWHYPHYYATTSPAQQRWVPIKTRRWRGSIRQGDWKLLEYFEDKRIELYNLKEDISEENPPEADSNAHTESQIQLQGWKIR